jgi:hypothetical protein
MDLRRMSRLAGAQDRRIAPAPKAAVAAAG